MRIYRYASLSGLVFSAFACKPDGAIEMPQQKGGLNPGSSYQYEQQGSESKPAVGTTGGTVSPPATVGASTPPSGGATTPPAAGGTTTPPASVVTTPPASGAIVQPTIAEIPAGESATCRSEAGTTASQSNAPAPYGAAAHHRIGEFKLGSLMVTGPNKTCDNDGVTWVQPLQFNSHKFVSVTVSGVGGILYGWIDFNGDGDFSDAGELVVNADVNPGANQHEIVIPPNATGQAKLTTWARFRWGAYKASPSAYGNDTIGEVEDYQIEITN